MSRIYDRIKGLLPKKVSANSDNSDEQPKRSEEELETICESKSLLQKKHKIVLGKYGCYAWNHLCEDNENQIRDNQQDW